MYAYEKLMNENNLQMHNLPEDAQIGIKEIKQLENAIRMTEKRGQSVSPDVKRKIQAKDKWVCTEIIDFLNDEDDEEHEKNEVVKNELTAEQKKGIEIENELLSVLGEDEQIELTIEDLKSSAPKSYSVIFKNYDEGGHNGIKTTKISLLETEEMVFTLTTN